MDYCHRHNLPFISPEAYRLHLEIEHGRKTKNPKVKMYQSKVEQERQFSEPNENPAHSQRLSRYFGGAE